MASLFTQFAWSIPVYGELGPVNPVPPSPKNPGARPSPPPPVNHSESLRAQADALTPKIDRLKNPPISKQRPTPRRARIAEGMYQEGERLERQQIFLRALADAMDANTLPAALRGIYKRTQVEEILRRDNSDPVRQALESISNHKGPSKIDQRIRELERKLIGQAIPGYFPTPPDVVARMLELAGDDVGTFILEPSAGKGNIACALRQKYPGAIIDTLEADYLLAEILELKGFHVAGRNFLDYQAPADCIVMNPPFENNQDIKHILHAYEILNVGGVLVSIVSEGAFFRKDRTAQAFREWLQETGAYSEKNPDGAFLKSERPTGVHTRVIRVIKR